MAITTGTKTITFPRPELWGGVECTLNRIGDSYYSQIQRSGHRDRIADLDLFAGLGIRTLRYPMLWETAAPDSPYDIDHSWAGSRLARMAELDMEPIAGLVHHGSGPAYTNLLDENFPEYLEYYARSFAQKFPHVAAYTPVNEPLTTARFSGLYGHWYPHMRDGAACMRMLLNQCKGTILAMRAVRDIHPGARLVQTEDLGKIYATKSIRYQADFENERRWLSWDLLCGRVDKYHPLWDYLLWLGIPEKELYWFCEHATAPDIIGINYYLTSERFLDTRMRRYPREQWGGNGRHKYADTEAVRSCGQIAGIGALLRETWERYGIPLALTEIHLGCTREEQMRWLSDAFSEAQGLIAEGIDVRALTAWALLGSFDWSSLVRDEKNHYESGAFDLRAAQPRPTALAAMVSSLNSTGEYKHPVLATPGWWKRSERFLHKYMLQKKKHGTTSTGRQLGEEQ